MAKHFGKNFTWRFCYTWPGNSTYEFDFTLRMMFFEPFANVCLIAIFSARNVEFDHLDPLKTKGPKRFSSEVQFTESFIYIHDIHSSWTNISPRSDVLKGAISAILSYSYVLVVHLYDSVPWTFISSSKVTSSLEDLDTYVMWTSEVWCIFFQSGFQTLKLLGCKSCTSPTTRPCLPPSNHLLKTGLFFPGPRSSVIWNSANMKNLKSTTSLRTFPFGFTDFQD